MPTTLPPPTNEGAPTSSPPPHGERRSHATRPTRPLAAAQVLRAREARGFHTTPAVDGTANALCRTLAEVAADLEPDARDLSPAVYRHTATRVRARITRLRSAIPCGDPARPLRVWRRGQLIALDDAAHVALRTLGRLRAAHEAGTLVEHVRPPDAPDELFDASTQLSDVDLVRVAHALTLVNSARRALAREVAVALSAQIGAATFAYLTDQLSTPDTAAPVAEAAEEEPPHDSES